MTLDVILGQGIASLWGWSRGCTPRPGYALKLMLYMPSRHHAIGLQTNCVVVMPAPMVRLPDSHVYARPMAL